MMSVRWFDLRKKVKAVIDGMDPEGLLKMGAPADEYDSEVADFTTQIDNKQPITVETVTATWVRWFGMDGHPLVRRKPDVISRRRNMMAELAKALSELGDA